MKRVGFFAVIILSSLLWCGAVCAGGAGGYGGKSPGYSYPYGTSGTHGSSGTSGTYGDSGGGYGLAPQSHSAYRGGQARPSLSDGVGSDEYGGRGAPSEACTNFFNKTVGLRREFEIKRFDYWELKRDPKATPEDLARGQEGVQTLFKKIQEENRDGCRWQN